MTRHVRSTMPSETQNTRATTRIHMRSSAGIARIRVISRARSGKYGECNCNDLSNKLYFVLLIRSMIKNKACSYNR